MWVWLAISFSALLHITAAYNGPKWQYYLFKPFTMVLLMVVAWQSGLDGFYHQAIFVGLILSVVGDILLMLPKDRFVPGLVSFLLAHIAYSLAFWSQFEGNIIWWLPALLFAGGIIVFLLFLPSLGSLILPVALYIAVIVQMAWAAGEFWLTVGSTASVLAFAGALVFMLSDTVLAMNRFRGPLTSATAVVMTSYYLAQALFVASLLA
ncbi:lysoplasmalogenase [Photobacterium sp. J15]|uniref:lysoplasmalogenase n=1 Tax=Photobacterium sp. J15 TaxID=265901 RepID=UPI0007E43048|nr:lysoplasmalogenase [Photobacterium sp. J15]